MNDKLNEKTFKHIACFAIYHRKGTILESLTLTETNILISHVMFGYTDTQHCNSHSIKKTTLHKHKRNICKKLNIETDREFGRQLIVAAVDHLLTQQELFKS